MLKKSRFTDFYAEKAFMHFILSHLVYRFNAFCMAAGYHIQVNYHRLKDDGLNLQLKAV